MPCPYLKEVVMLFCAAYPVKKMVPLDRITTASPCLTEEFQGCPLFRELLARMSAASERESPALRVGSETPKETRP